MDHDKIRCELIEYGKKLITSGLTKGTGGNLSYYDREQDVILITPSGIPFHEILPEDIIVINIRGEILEGSKVPSCEWEMHCKIYEVREDINAVIHAHTIFATIFACLRTSIPASHYMIAVAGKDIQTMEYASFGSPELAVNASKGMKDRNATLLANHGIIAGDKDLANAFNIIDEVEYCAEIHYRAMTIGNPVVLDDNEMMKMAKKFTTYGQV